VINLQNDFPQEKSSKFVPKKKERKIVKNDFELPKIIF